MGEAHESSYLLSYCYLHRPQDNTKLLKFLRLPKSYRQNRSKVESDASPIEGQSGVDLAAPRPTESTPDLRIGASVLPLRVPSRVERLGMGGLANRCDVSGQIPVRHKSAWSTSEMESDADVVVRTTRSADMGNCGFEDIERPKQLANPGVRGVPDKRE